MGDGDSPIAAVPRHGVGRVSAGAFNRSVQDLNNDGVSVCWKSDGAHVDRRYAAFAICIVVRHSVNVVAIGATLAAPVAPRPLIGILIPGSIVLWSLYRLATRSQQTFYALVDSGAAALACIGLPALVLQFSAAADGVPREVSTATNTAPQAMAATALATLAIQLAVKYFLPVAAMIIASYVWGVAVVNGWYYVGFDDDLAYLLMAAAIATLVRPIVWQVQDAVRMARLDRRAAEVDERVAEARRKHDAEQLAALHDTAAATLMLVNAETPISPDRLGARAARDLRVLVSHEGPDPGSAPVDISASIRREAEHVSTSVVFTGSCQVMLAGGMAVAVTSAAREVLTNVDRHASATQVEIDIDHHRIRLTDNGVGFDAGSTRYGHGIAESVVNRMDRVGGSAIVHSVPGGGTVVELRWTSSLRRQRGARTPSVADRSIHRTRFVYTLIVTVFALVNLVAVVNAAVRLGEFSAWQWLLVAVTGVCALGVYPGIGYGIWWPARVAAGTLAVVAVLAPLHLTPNQLASDANWSLSAVGYCLLPQLLNWRMRWSAALLAGYLLVPAALEFGRAPYLDLLLYLGMSVASFLIPQMGIAAFGSFAQSAMRATRREHRARLDAETKERIADAVRRDYACRYAETIARLIPLLTELSKGDPVTEALRVRARIELRRLRFLFDQQGRSDATLVGELQPVIDGAERRGVDISVHLGNDLPSVSDAEKRMFLKPLNQLLIAADSFARIVVTATAHEVIGSVVCDTRSATEVKVCGGDPRVEVVRSGETVWATVRHAVEATS